MEKEGPNILITGTPGVGKSKLSEMVCAETSLKWVNIGQIAEEKQCYEEFDPVYQCHVLDEDKVIDILDPQLIKGGNVVDYHGSDFFPKRWFDLVLVLRTKTQVLYDRLTSRGYSGKKLEDNIQCEIFQMMLEEAKQSYDEEIVKELTNNNEEDLKKNVDCVVSWVEEWRRNNS